MNLLLVRIDYSSTRTIGALFAAGRWLCYTLEDPVRRGPKVPGATAIPAGTYAVSVALWEKGKPVLGVVYHPALRELFWAVKGGGAFLNKKRLAVSRTYDPNAALLATGFPYDLRESRENNLDYFAAFATRVRAIRRMGAAALDIAWTAAGRFDGFWELKLFPWDIAAAVLLVSEAGGKLSDFQGRPLGLGTQNVVASNGRLHNFILRVIEECRQKGATIVNREQQMWKKKEVQT